MTGSAPATEPTAQSSADSLTTVALLNCLLREVTGPRGQSRTVGTDLLITLPGTGHTLRAELRRPSRAEPRPSGLVEQWHSGSGWSPLGWRQLTELVQAELSAELSGGPHPSLLAEVTGSHDFIEEVLRRRTEPSAGSAETHADSTFGSSSGYLASEQSLIAGHRFHPSPKARSGSMTDALAYAPETRGEFRLRYLAVPGELIQQHEAYRGAASVFDQPESDGIRLPAGHRLLPVHPWQYQILCHHELFRRSLVDRRLLDLGERGDSVRPTASVRTVARRDGTGFLKLSLGVQITNCLRINPPHEIQAAVWVSRSLEPLRCELSALYPGTVVLSEPASRTVDLGPDDADRELAGGLGVIAREGLSGRLPPGVRPLLAAALVEPHPDPAVAAAVDAVTANRDHLLGWWEGYLARLIPPVLHAFLAHGVVFEAHLQNVVIGLDAGRQPTHLILRDLEGVKLVGPRYAGGLAELPPRVREHLGYPAELGWNRVAYCLFVNNVSSVLGMLADRDPGAERMLWLGVRRALQAFRRDHGDAPQLRSLLAGLPVPAKTNLLTRWHRSADRDSGYVPVSLPIGPPARLLSRAHHDHRPRPEGPAS